MSINITNYAETLHQFDNDTKEDILGKLSAEDIATLKSLAKILAVRLYSTKKEKIVDTLTELIYSRIRKGDAFRN